MHPAPCTFQSNIQSIVSGYISDSCTILAYHSQVSLPSLPSPVLTSQGMSVELSMSLWDGPWVVETVLISTLLPTIPRHPMGNFWTSPLPVLHCWLVLQQATSIISQYVVSTVEVRRGVRVSCWQLPFKVRISVCLLCYMCLELQSTYVANNMVTARSCILCTTGLNIII